jgi:hypothetical protein
MNDIYRGVKITTKYNGFNGKWSASWTFPGEEEAITTPAWAGDESALLSYIKSRIDLFLKEVNYVSQN